MKKIIVFVIVLLIAQQSLLSQTPVSVNQGGGITILKGTDSGLSSTYISNQDLYNKISKACHDAEARQKKTTTRTSTNNTVDAARQAEIAAEKAKQEALKQARLEEERRKEQARIKKAGDDYVRQNSARYEQKKSEAHWQATVGKEILREKTAPENYFTPGSRVIERNEATYSLPQINTNTDKSNFALRLHQKKFENRTFQSLNVANPYYSPDFNIGHFREAIQSVAVMPQMVDSRQIDQVSFLDEAWAQMPKLAEAGRQTMGDEAWDRVTGFAKSTIASVNPICKEVTRAYDAVMHVGDVKNKSVEIIEDALETVLNTVKTGDYSLINRYFDRTKVSSEKQLTQMIRNKFGQTSSTNNAIEDGEDFIAYFAFWKKWNKE